MLSRVYTSRAPAAYRREAKLNPQSVLLDTPTHSHIKTGMSNSPGPPVD